MPDKNITDKIIEAVLKVIKADKIILFGSQARGDARPDSDYDILVVKDNIENELKIEGQIYRNFIGLGVPVDVIVTTSSKLNKHKDSIGYIYKNIFKEGITIYG